MKSIATIILLFCFSIFLAACSKPSVEGDVFIVKGDGSVKPSPGRTIYFLNVSTELGLIHDFATRAYKKSYPKQLGILIDSCYEALDFTNNSITENEKAIENMVNFASVPVENCDKFETQVELLSNESNQLRVEHNKKIRFLKTSIAEAQANRDVESRANFLKDQELSNIEVELRKQDRKSLDIVFRNLSEKYCLYQDLNNVFSKDGLKIDFYAGKYIAAQGDVNFALTRHVDANGILTYENETSPCVLKPGESKTPSITMRWEYHSSVPKITSLKLRNASMRAPVNGDLIPINWESLALKTFDFSEAESDIANANTALKKEIERYEESTVKSDLVLQEQELKRCETQFQNYTNEEKSRAKNYQN